MSLYVKAMGGHYRISEVQLLGESGYRCHCCNKEADLTFLCWISGHLTGWKLCPECYSERIVEIPEGVVEA